jgi:protein TonB
MFTQLVESKPAAKRGGSGAAVSFVAHYGLILAVLYTSAEARSIDAAPREETVTFVQPETHEPPETQPPELVAAPIPTKAPLAVVAPIEIPSVLPDIDLTRAPTDPNQFTGRPQPGSATSGSGVASPEPAPSPNKDYLEFEVEKPVMQAANSAVPAYPDILRQAGVEGEALVSFVVDTLGRVDLSTFKVIRTTHELFATSVRNTLPRMRFIPAETTRGRVRQLVQQPYSFAIVK